MLDEAELLARFDGDALLCGDLLRMFLRDAPSAINALCEARAAGDREALGREAHSLRGAAAYVSAQRVQSGARAVERCAAQGPLDDIDRRVAELAEELRGLGVAAMRSFPPPR